MTQYIPAAPHDDLAKTVAPGRDRFPSEESPLVAVRNFIAKTLTIVGLEVRKIRHDPTDLLTRAVQPALWLLIFGEVFTRLRAIPTGGRSYLDFMAPGILAQSVLFIAIFSGIAIIWERDLGITSLATCAIRKHLSGSESKAEPAWGSSISLTPRELANVRAHGITRASGPL